MEQVFRLLVEGHLWLHLVVLLNLKRVDWAFRVDLAFPVHLASRVRSASLARSASLVRLVSLVRSVSKQAELEQKLRSLWQAVEVLMGRRLLEVLELEQKIWKQPAEQVVVLMRGQLLQERLLEQAVLLATEVLLVMGLDLLVRVEGHKRLYRRWEQLLAEEWPEAPSAVPAVEQLVEGLVERLEVQQPGVHFGLQQEKLGLHQHQLVVKLGPKYLLDHRAGYPRRREGHLLLVGVSLHQEDRQVNHHYFQFELCPANCLEALGWLKSLLPKRQQHQGRT